MTKHNTNGFILITTLLAISISSLILMAATHTLIQKSYRIKLNYYSKQAYYLALSGLHKSLKTLDIIPQINPATKPEELIKSTSLLSIISSKTTSVKAGKTDTHLYILSSVDSTYHYALKAQLNLETEKIDHIQPL